ncbi:MAG: hypothetical protein V3U87_01295, partial [Methylococcaceae bacterium]
SFIVNPTILASIIVGLPKRRQPNLHRQSLNLMAVLLYVGVHTYLRYAVICAPIEYGERKVKLILHEHLITRLISQKSTINLDFN